jgi:hypothetical protein
MKNGIETWPGFRYTLSMTGVILSGPTYVYGDNIWYVVHNTQRSESVLKKKSNSICYHEIHESAAMGEESIIGHVHCVDNPADMCTKVVSGGNKWNHLIHLLLHYMICVIELSV